VKRRDVRYEVHKLGVPERNRHFQNLVLEMPKIAGHTDTHTHHYTITSAVRKAIRAAYPKESGKAQPAWLSNTTWDLVRHRRHYTQKKKWAQKHCRDAQKSILFLAWRLALPRQPPVQHKLDMSTAKVNGKIVARCDTFVAMAQR
jgi:hypothetical protein